MFIEIKTFRELVTAFGGVAAFAGRLQLVRSAIHNWEARGEIPPRQCERIVDLAETLGIEGVTYLGLRRLAFDDPGPDPVTSDNVPACRSDNTPVCRSDNTAAHYLSQRGAAHG